VTSAWNSGYVATVTVTNNAASAISGWSLQWDFIDGERNANAWNVVLTQDGATARAANVDWNATIAAGGSVSFGFQVGHDGSSIDVPEQFLLNDTACQ
jgi:cellulase/cellobiase CelA1